MSETRTRMHDLTPALETEIVRRYVGKQSISFIRLALDVAPANIRKALVKNNVQIRKSGSGSPFSTDMKFAARS